MTFSINTQQAIREEITSILNVTESADFGKYLGLPSVIGKNKKQVFSYIYEKISNRIGTWSKKFITKAGREILLKTVAQSMPTYAMSTFLLPKTMCGDIERLLNRY